MAGESTNSRLTSVQIRLQNNQYTDEIPISVLASNIIYDPGNNSYGGINYGYNLVETLGNVDVTNKGSLQTQINNLFTNLLSNMTSIALANIPNAVKNWLDDNYTTSGSITTDKSLTSENVPADAKAAGSIIEINSIQPTAQSNKIWIKPSVNSVTVPTMLDIENIIAPLYNPQSPYSVGDYVIHNDLLYRCTTAIGSSGEAWTSGHWTQVTIGNLIKQLFNQSI